MTQRTNNSSSGHAYWLHLEGDDNDIYTVQREGGSQYINLDVYTDGNDVDLIQTNDGDHYMSVILRGTEPTDVDITRGKSIKTNHIVSPTIAILLVVVQSTLRRTNKNLNKKPSYQKQIFEV